MEILIDNVEYVTIPFTGDYLLVKFNNQKIVGRISLYHSDRTYASILYQIINLFGHNTHLELKSIDNILVTGISYNKMPVQAILFDKDLYSLSDAEKWVDNHGFVPLKPGKLEGNYYRFRILDPEQLDRFRTKEVTQGIKFIFGWSNKYYSSV